MHFDEAWSANFAADMAANWQGAWRSQSAYTEPWSQIWASFCFRALGTNLFVFRLANILAACLGLIFILMALFRAGYLRTALLFPLLTASLSGIAVNHRFAIEITGFHVFCFGLFLMGFERRVRLLHDKKAYLAMGLGAILGVSSHILFLAPVVGLLLWILLEDIPLSRADRLFLLLLDLVFLPFFLSVLVGIPEKGKGALLVLFSLALLVWLLKGMRKIPLLEKNRARLQMVIWIFAIPFLCNTVVFADGHWSFLVTHGGLVFPMFVAVTGIACALVVLRAFRKGEFDPAALRFLRYSVLVILVAGLIVLKPAPRYYEIPMLLFAMAAAYGMSKLPLRAAIVFAILVFGASSSSIWANYFLPGIQGWSQERPVQFLLFKDSSRDFLSKQNLVLRLAGRGCGPQDIATQDGRVAEALKFLARGDWAIAKEAPPCKQFRVERRAELETRVGSEGSEVIADFLVWSEHQ